jgi:glycosyltransferase involved in cell wall biosynthesis
MNSLDQKALVSVVICAYNAGKFLRPSVESILGQTYGYLDVIVVDDGSTDSSMATIEGLADVRMRIVRQQNLGKPAALNRALELVRGEFYAVHDADDISHPCRIERQFGCLRDHPDTAAVLCGYDLILNGRNVAPKFGHKNHAECRSDIERMSMPGHDPTAMYRVSLVRDLRYDESLPIVEGYDYLIRVGERYPILVLGECLYSYRIHADTVTKRNPGKRQALLENAMDKILERRGMPARAYRAGGQRTISRWTRNRHSDNDIVSHFMVSVVDLRHHGRWRESLDAAATCLQLHPSDPYYYKPAAYAVLPLWLIDAYRARKQH